MMLSAIAGYDSADVSTLNVATTDYARAIGTRTSKLRVGTPRDPYFENLDPEIAKAVDAALDVIRKIGGEVRDVSIPASPGLGDVSNAEIYAYHQPWITKTPELYQQATRGIVQGGANAKPDVYAQGLRRVELARREIVRTFESVDLLVMPTTSGAAGVIPATTPPPAPGAAPAAAGGAAGFRNTSYFSFFGLPAISVPCGFTTSGLPIGLQISAAPFAESTVLALAHAYEQATEWHKKRPKLALNMEVV